MSKINLLTIRAFASVLILFLSACAEDPLGGNDQTGKGSHTVTLRLLATVAPIPETKVSVTPTRPGSETEPTGFYYEMVSSDAETATATSDFNIEIVPIRKDSTDVNFGTKALATKAPSGLKNAYALLFTNGGAFNGCASIGAFMVGTPQDITFTKVVNPTATGCRLVIVANDNAAITPYVSSKGTGGFAGFTGTYAEFQQLTLTSGISKDEDVPYAGSATVNLSLNEIGATAEVTLFRTLAKITLDNSVFKITGGPARSNITLHNAGTPCFAPIGTNNYDGTGTTLTTSGFVVTTAGGNANTTTWYVGENIQGTVGNISSAADRNSAKAPTNACYIRITSATLPIPANTSPTIGQEYRPTAGNKSFTYDLYLGKSSDPKDFSLRRNTNYTITSEISGTLIEQEQLAAADGRVTLTKPESGGLVIGRFGGASNYTTGDVASSILTGSYTKMLLLEPNTSRTTAADTVNKVFAMNSTACYQTDTRCYWDRTYIYGITTDGTVGGMDKVAGSLYDYCYQLTLGDVEKGTWYVPTQAQLQTVWTVREGLKENAKDYAGFVKAHYWCCTDFSESNAWYVHLMDGYTSIDKRKSELGKIRCVRDLPSPGTSEYVTVVGGYPVIDLSELTPLGCLLTGAEADTRRKAINGYTPSYEAMQPGSGHSGIWNVKMSSKFQMMRADHVEGRLDYIAAHAACKKYAAEGGVAGEWRLPTQRELVIMWMLYPQMKGKGGFVPFSRAYRVFHWCCTEYNATMAWGVWFNSGETTSHWLKTEQNYVRCVRDL